MNFNDDWSKEDNDKLRQLIKEHKTPDEIISIMGFEKLDKNPKKKYVGKFSEFVVNEIYIREPKNTIYTLTQNKSTHFPNNLDYEASFKTNSEENYILDLIYIEDLFSPFPNRSMYNISFTTKFQHDLTNSLKYEKETGKDEFFEIMSRLTYILCDIDNYIITKIPNIVYIIGETPNPQKINSYRDLVKTSLSQYQELKGNSSINLGRPVYYYFK